MNLRPIILLAVTLFTLASCTSAPELQKYSRSEIDRPFTLPKGVAAWHIALPFYYWQDDKYSYVFPPIPNPVIWETAISDSWNLIYYPLPLAFRYQISHSETSRLGFTYTTGFRYSSLEGFSFAPDLSFSYRHRLTPTVALEISPSLVPTLPTQRGEEVRWSAQATAGLLLQISPTFALNPAILAGFTTGSDKYLNDYRNKDELVLADEESNALGLGLQSIWSISRQWDLKSSYKYRGIGDSNGLQAHRAIVDFVHFW